MNIVKLDQENIREFKIQTDEVITEQIVGTKKYS